MCRFINEDEYVQTGQGVLDKNMFAYCANNPINRFDDNGDSWTDIKHLLSNKFISLKRFANNLLYKLNSTIKPYHTAEHKKKGTVNEHNRNKHEKGQARKNRDSGGEKGDARRTPNPNKRKSAQSNSVVLEKTIYCVAIVFVSLMIAYVVLNDATVIGALDDTLIAPLSMIFWEYTSKVIS